MGAIRFRVKRDPDRNLTNAQKAEEAQDQSDSSKKAEHPTKIEISGPPTYSREKRLYGVARPYRAYRKAPKDTARTTDDSQEQDDNSGVPKFEPLVDLTRETCITRSSWRAATESRKALHHAPEKPFQLKPCDDSDSSDDEFLRKPQTHYFRPATVVSGPCAMSINLKNKEIDRYRVEDHEGNEILVYFTSPKMDQNTPPAIAQKNRLRQAAQEKKKYGIHVLKASEILGMKQKPKRLITRINNDPNKPNLKFITKTDFTDPNHLLHPFRFASMCFPGCAPCNYPESYGVPNKFLHPCGKVCRDLLTCVPAVSQRELFCCSTQQGLVEAVKHNRSEIIISPREILGVAFPN